MFQNRNFLISMPNFMLSFAAESIWLILKQLIIICLKMTTTEQKQKQEKNVERRNHWFSVYNSTMIVFVFILYLFPIFFLFLDISFSIFPSLFSHLQHSSIFCTFALFLHFSFSHIVSRAKLNRKIATLKVLNSLEFTDHMRKIKKDIFFPEKNNTRKSLIF